MAKNTTKKLINELERVFGVLIYESPVKAAERVVTELQQEGPIWTGKYANSWQIEAAGTVVKGNGQGGSPRPLKMPKLTTKQNEGCKLIKLEFQIFLKKLVTLKTKYQEDLEDSRLHHWLKVVNGFKQVQEEKKVKY